MKKNTNWYIFKVVISEFYLLYKVEKII